MALRRHVGVVVAVLALAACKSKGTSQGSATDLDQACEKLAKACGDSDKHVAKIVDECRAAAKPQAEKGCAAKVTAAYECFEKELCGKSDRVWTLDDLGVLADRKSKCVAERNAARDCGGQ
jgi:hypothetical protein